MALFRFFFIALIFTMPSALFAEKIDQAETLTWFNCVKEAARNNPNLESAYQALQNSEATRKASYSAFFPQLSANADLTHSFQPRDNNGSAGDSAPFSSSLALKEYTTDYSANLQLQQLLFDGFRAKGTVDQARAQSRASLAALSQEKAVVSYELKSAFAQLLYAQELITISQDIKKRRDLNYRLIDLRYESGKENKGALLLSKANLSQAQFDLQQAMRNNEVSQRQLSQVMGRDQFRPIQADGYLTTRPVTSFHDFRSLALVTPAHYQLEAQSQAAAAGITIARSDWFPQIHGLGTLNTRGNDRFPEYDGWSVGVSASLNVFDWGKTYFNVKAARRSFTFFSRIAIFR
ncbi:MAG: TolC family protein [Verrucomicrobiia bacterium]